MKKNTSLIILLMSLSSSTFGTDHFADARKEVDRKMSQSNARIDHKLINAFLKFDNLAVGIYQRSAYSNWIMTTLQNMDHEHLHENLVNIKLETQKNASLENLCGWINLFYQTTYSKALELSLDTHKKNGDKQSFDDTVKTITKLDYYIENSATMTVNTTVIMARRKMFTFEDHVVSE